MCQMLRAGWWKGSDKHLVPGTEALHGMLTPVPIFLFQVCAVWCYQSCWPPLWAPWLPFLTVPVLCSRWTFTPEFGTGHPRRSWCWLAGERSRASAQTLSTPWAQAASSQNPGAAWSLPGRAAVASCGRSSCPAPRAPFGKTHRAPEGIDSVHEAAKLIPTASHGYSKGNLFNYLPGLRAAPGCSINELVLVDLLLICLWT